MELSDVQRRFVLHWGEMGTRWGVNRTVAQIHALLYVTGDSLCAEEIAETLSVARSNVSTSIRELNGWGLVRVSQKLGDRRDYFGTHSDVWEMFRIVMEERKQREIDPTIALLRECVAEAKTREKDPDTRKRLAGLLDFMETMDRWYGQMRRLPPAAFSRMAKMGSRLASLLGGRK